MFYFFLLNTSVVVFCTLFFRFSLCFLFSTFFFTLFSQNSYALVISSQLLGCNFFIFCFFFFFWFFSMFFIFHIIFYSIFSKLLCFISFFSTLWLQFLYPVFRFFSLFFNFSHSFSFLPPNCDSFLQPHPTRERGREIEIEMREIDIRLCLLICLLQEEIVSLRYREKQVNKIKI